MSHRHTKRVSRDISTPHTIPVMCSRPYLLVVLLHQGPRHVAWADEFIHEFVKVRPRTHQPHVQRSRSVTLAPRLLASRAHLLQLKFNTVAYGKLLMMALHTCCSQGHKRRTIQPFKHKGPGALSEWGGTSRTRCQSTRNTPQRLEMCNSMLYLPSKCSRFSGVFSTVYM